MNILKFVVFVLLLLVFGSVAYGQADDDEQLKIAALEALMSAPPERALPIATKVLETNNSNEVKSRALFVLSQIDHPDAQAALVEAAKSPDPVLKVEAVRMIGIGGDPEALAGLSDIYATGDTAMKEAVLEAYLIADDSEAVYRIAANTTDSEDFDRAVEMLGAMGAHEELRRLRSSAGASESLINAYAIAGDIDSLRELALDGSNPELQVQAIRGLGIAGSDNVSEVLFSLYQDAESEAVRDAALEGMLIAGNDDSVLRLYRASEDSQEKRRLLEMLVAMGSDAVWDEIDKALGDGE